LLANAEPPREVLRDAAERQLEEPARQLDVAAHGEIRQEPAVLQDVADMPAAPAAHLVGIGPAPGRADVERLAAERREHEPADGRRLQDHREQFEQRALARAALADQRELRAARDVEPRDAEAELDASGAV